MMDNIPFNEWSRNRIREGRKICTSRHKRYPRDERVTYISPKLPKWFIVKYLWEPEGANSPDELEDVLRKIYKRRIPDDERFYVHFGDFRKEAGE